MVLLDAMMPGMDGFEVARRSRPAPQTAHIPDHLHDRPDRDRAPGGRAGSRWRRLRDQTDQAQGGAGAHGGAPAGRARKTPDPQCARCLWLCQHHRARERRPPDVANPAGARPADALLRHRRAHHADSGADLAAPPCGDGPERCRAAAPEHRAGPEAPDLSPAPANWRQRGRRRLAHHHAGGERREL